MKDLGKFVFVKVFFACLVRKFLGFAWWQSVTMILNVATQNMLKFNDIANKVRLDCSSIFMNYLM